MRGPAVINVLMALVSNITNNIVLIHIDTLAQVIDGNPMKLPNFLPLDAIYPPSAPFRAPPGESRDGLKSPLMTFRRTYPAFWFSLSPCGVLQDTNSFAFKPRGFNPYRDVDFQCKVHN